MPLKRKTYQQCGAAAEPPGPIETLTFAILHGTYDVFQKSIENHKVYLFITKKCLFNYAYKSLLILTSENQLGAPGAPPDPLSISAAL